MVERNHNKIKGINVKCRLNEGKIVPEFKPIFEELREEGIVTGEGITGCGTCIRSRLDQNAQYAIYYGSKGRDHRYVVYSSEEVAQKIVELAEENGIEAEWDRDTSVGVKLQTEK
jgi:hypothetical protein